MGIRRYDGPEYLSYWDNRMNISCDAGTKDRMERLMVYYHGEISERFKGSGVSRLIRWLVAKQYEKMKAECYKRSKNMDTEIISRAKQIRTGAGLVGREAHVRTYLTHKQEGNHGGLGEVRKESGEFLWDKHPCYRRQKGDE